MGNLERISVIIPVYNTEKYLESSVKSVMNQTYGNLEIICVNDGSTDGSLGILERLKEEDDRIIIVNKENGGLSDARNAGLNHVTSEWVSFLDSDDTLQENTFEVVSKAFAYNPDMIHFGVNLISEGGEALKPSDIKYYFIKKSGFVNLDDSIIKMSDVLACNKLFRKSVLDRYNIRFDRIWYEDFPFTRKYMFSVRNVYYIQDKLYNYLRRSGSIMTETFCGTPKSIDHLYGFNHILEFLEERGELEMHTALMCHEFARSYLLSLRHTTDEMIPVIVDYATGIYNKYDFLQDRFKVKKKNGTIVFDDTVRSKEHSIISKVLEFFFAIKKELINYRIYKTVRLFGVIVLKKRVL